MLLGTMTKQAVEDERSLAAGRHFWITGAYRKKWARQWISFAYGPFPDRIVCEVRSNDDARMLEALGSSTMEYEIDCTDPLWRGQANKHFEETIMSEYWKEIFGE
jgi:hypothetical protein